MEAAELSRSFQKLSLQHKSAISLEKRPDYVMDIAAQNSLQGAEDALLAAASSNHSIQLFSRSHLSQTAIFTGHTDAISSLQFPRCEPDLLLSSSHDKTVRIWDHRASTTKEAQLFQVSPGAEAAGLSILSASISSSGRMICAGTEKGEEDVYLLFWDVRKGLQGCYSQSHDDDITQVKFHPVVDRYLMTGSTDGLLNVFDLVEQTEDDALMSTFNTEATVARAGWCGPESVSGQSGQCGIHYVYCITHMDTWHVWHFKEGDSIQQVTDIKEQLQEKGVDYLVDCVCGATDSERWAVVAGSHNGTLCLLDVSNPSEVKVSATLEGGHTDTVRCLNWDVKTGTLVTGGEDSLLCLWSPSAASTLSASSHQSKIKPKKSSAARNSKPYSSKKER